MAKLRLGRRYYFSAIHTIPQEDFVHGHNYELDVSISGVIQDSGWIGSREEIDNSIEKSFLSLFHRQWINDSVLPATGENLVQFAFEVISKALPSGLQLEEVQLHETRKNSFTTISQ